MLIALAVAHLRSFSDRLALVAYTLLVIQLAITFALTGSDRGHAFAHLFQVFLAVGTCWLIAERWVPLDLRPERWARRGLLVAIGITATAWALEALGALGWNADGRTPRWAALTAWHDEVFVRISQAGVLLVLATFVTTALALILRAVHATHPRKRG